MSPTESSPKLDPPKTDTDFSRILKTSNQGYVSVSVYLDHRAGRTFYDIVIYRKVRDKTTGASTWKRGANLKPTDIPSLVYVLQEIQAYLEAKGIHCLSLVDPSSSG